MNKSTGKEYFNWLCQFVCGKGKSKFSSYGKLLRVLHKTEFTWTIPMDSNRAGDGGNLRRRFGVDIGNKPCSVLEMMIALSLRCEESIMSDPDKGDRTGQWFWNMIVNLGLGNMTDPKFDKEKAQSIISRFLNRTYEPNGKGGLFTIQNSSYDLTTVEIWCQAMWYLDEAGQD